jgi:hypothetical protein
MFLSKQGRLRGCAMLFIRRRTGVKLGDVSPKRQIDAKLVPVHRIVVVLSDSLTHLAGGYADDRIIVAVVVWSPAEEFAAEDALFETIFLSVEGFLNDMPEKWGVSLALSEERTRQHPLQLIDGQHPLPRTEGCASDRGIFGHRHRSRIF